MELLVDTRERDASVRATSRSVDGQLDMSFNVQAEDLRTMRDIVAAHLCWWRVDNGTAFRMLTVGQRTTHQRLAAHPCGRRRVPGWPACSSRRCRTASPPSFATRTAVRRCTRRRLSLPRRADDQGSRDFQLAPGRCQAAPARGRPPQRMPFSLRMRARSLRWAASTSGCRAFAFRQRR